MFKVIFLIFSVFSVVFFGCASSAPATSSSSARAGSGAQTVAQPVGQPAWVSAPYSVYPENSYVAVTGFGSDRRSAEMDAFARLVGVFNMSVEADLTLITRYSEAVSNSGVQFSENTDVQNAIRTSSQIDTLVGAEIRDVWFDNRQTYYALAVMERARTRVLYTDIINANRDMINRLVNISEEERYSFDGFARYNFAAVIADANSVYVNVLSVIGSPTSFNDLRRGDHYRLTAAEIAGNISIGINIDYDRSNRIRDAFANAVRAQGFRSGGSDARYIININMNLSPVDLPNQQNSFVRYEVSANLIDTSSGTVILPFNISGREGHITVSEAENRAVAAATSKINNEYSRLLENHLTSLLPVSR